MPRNKTLAIILIASIVLSLLPEISTAATPESITGTAEISVEPDETLVTEPRLQQQEDDILSHLDKLKEKQARVRERAQAHAQARKNHADRIKAAYDYSKSQDVTGKVQGTAEEGGVYGESNYPIALQNITFPSGSGSSEAPYVITTPAQLDAIRLNPDKHYILGANIDLSGYSNWEPLGDFPDAPFSGGLDGNGYSILGLSAELFNYTAATSVLQNIKLENFIGMGSAPLVDWNQGDISNCSVSGSFSDSRSSGLVDYNEGGTISNCHVTVVDGNVRSGLIDYNEGGIISNCHVTVIDGHIDSGLIEDNEGGEISHCTVSGEINGGGGWLSGLVGYNSGGQIFNCQVTATINGSHPCGLVGYNVYGNITNCIFIGDIFSYRGASGLVEYNDHGTIADCTFSGSITGDDYASGLVDYNDHGTISDCTFSGNISGLDCASGLVEYNTGTIVQSFAVADIVSNGDAGGLVGFNEGNIYSSLAWGTVRADANAGGIVGYHFKGEVSHCYALQDWIRVTGNSTEIGRIVGGQYGGVLSRNYSSLEMSLRTARGKYIPISAFNGKDGANVSPQDYNKLFHSFSLPGQLAPARIDYATRTISVPMADGINLTALAAGFIISDGASAHVAGIKQVSDSTTNDFTSSVKYKITASDGSSSLWDVQIINEQVYTHNFLATLGQALQCTYVGDPVNVSTGNFIDTYTDISIASVGIPLEFIRHYNSLDTESGPLGPGWQHNYNTYITFGDEQSVSLRYPDGQTALFTYSDGEFNSQAGIHEVMVRNPDNTFSLTFKDQTKYIYDTEGKLVRITDKNGNTISLTYTDSLLTKVTDTTNRALLFAYGPEKRLTEIIDPAGRTVSFTYHADGKLASYMSANGGTTNYEYDSNGLTSVINPLNNLVVENVYDEESRVIWQQDGRGNITTYIYDPENSQTTVTSSRGNDVVFHYDHHYRITAIEYPDELRTHTLFDEGGNIISTTDKNNNTTTYTYDGRGNMLTKTDARDQISSFTYDDKNNPILAIDAAGNATTFSYDEWGNLLETVTHVAGQDIVTSFSYNEYGQIVSMTDANGDIAKYQYDQYGYLAAGSVRQGYKPAPLATVPQPIWEGDVLCWSKVKNSLSYKLILYKDEVESAVIDVPVHISEYNFSQTIADLGFGNYTATVQAQGDGESFLDGPISPPTASNSHNPPAPIIRHEETDSAIIRSGIWYTQREDGHSEGGAIWSQAEGAYLEFTFIGTGIRLLGRKAATMGIVEVSIDGDPPVEVDLYSKSRIDQAVIFEELNLLPAQHTIRLALTGRKNEQASHHRSLFDALDVFTSSEDPIQLPPVNRPAWESDTLLWADIANAVGYEIILYKDGSQAAVENASQGVGEYDMAQLMSNLGFGNYTTMIRAMGDGEHYLDGPFSELSGVNEQLPPIGIRYEETFSAIIRSGIWYTQREDGHSEGGAIWSQAEGAYLEFTFIGTGIRLLGRKAATMGIVEVSIDENPPVEVDLYSKSRIDQAVIFEELNLLPAQHTIRLTLTGRKNEQASHHRALFDAFDVFTSLEDPSQLSQVNRPVWEGNTLLWTDIANAVGYEIILYKDGSQAAVENASQGVGEHDMAQLINSLGFGNYAAIIRAIGDGEHYLDGPLSQFSGNNEQLPPIGVRHEETDSAIIRSGIWYIQREDGHSDGSAIWSQAEGAYLEFTFIGTGIRLLGRKAATMGIVEVSIDEDPPVEVDLYSKSRIDQAIIFEKFNLLPAQHTIRLTLTGRKNEQASHHRALFDAYDVINPPVDPIQLPQVPMPLWDVDTLRWVGIGNAQAYQLTLYADGEQTALVSVPSGTKEYNFASDFANPDVGSYTATVRAMGDGKCYLDGLVSPPSSAIIRESSGITTSYTWDIIGNKLSETAPNGNLRGNNPAHFTHSLTYDLARNILTKKDPLGYITTYTYDLNDNLTSVTDPLGHTTAYTYDENNNLLTITDPLGGVTAYTYDEADNLLTETNGNGHTTSYTYDNLDRLIAVTDPQGLTETYTLDGNDNILAITNRNGYTTVFTYDENNNLLTTSDQLGGVFTYTYDALGNKLTETDSLGNTTTYTYDEASRLLTEADAMDNTISFAYDSTGNLIQRTDPKGNIATMSYGLNNQLISCSDALGYTTFYSYDANGNQVSVTNPLGNTATTSYDSLNRPIVATDFLGNTTTYTYDGNGNPLAIQDRRNAVTSFVYDALNRVTAVTDAAGGVTTYTHDALGNIQSETDSRGNATTYSYDNTNRLAAEEDALGNVIQYYYDGIGNIVSRVLPQGGTYAYTYDELGRETAVTEPLGQVSTTTYDGLGNILSHTNSLGHTTTFTYNPVGKITSATNALGYTTTYTYDENYNLLNVTDANGQTKTYEYDANNQVTAEIDSLNNRTEHQYDPLGDLSLKTKADGNTIEYNYDANSRLSQILYPDETTTAYTYDEEGNRTLMTDAHGMTSYTYDRLGHLITTTRAGTSARTVAYSYDQKGNITEITYPDGMVVSYIYDELDRQIQIQEGEDITTVSYDARGNRIQEELPNGTMVTYTYDGNDRLIQIKHELENEVIALAAYTLDNLGNRLTKTDEEGQTTYYSYDELSQLTAVLYPNETCALYTYDAVGNRLAENDVTYSYDGANQLVQAGVTIHTYDANGNLLSDGEKVYQYDHENRLIALTEGETATTYTYDGDGNRLSQSIEEGEEGTRSHEYIYDINKGFPELIVEIEGENEYIYIYADRVIGQITENGQAYYHQDGLGSTVLITDADGEELNRYEYDAFGAPDKLLETIHNPFLFTGEPHDANGLIFLRARYYDPATGRFLTRDTYLGALNEPLSQHLYIYVGNNPVLYVDPSGHLKICSGAKIQGGMRAYEIIDNFFMGRYFGTTYGEEALDWYTQQIVDREKGAKWYELVPYYAGAGFSALWTEDNYLYTVFVVAGAWEVGQRISAGPGKMREINTSKQEATATEGAGNTFGPMNKGPLPDNVANTFRSSSYTQKVSSGEYMYRVHGGTAAETGSYLSRTPQYGGMQSQLDLALNPAWGNTAANVSRVYVPKGTVYFEGYAAPQTINGGSGMLMGGGSQIYVPR